MATNILDKVIPGDIISSELMNYLLQKVVEMDQRISDLESKTPSGNVVISSFEPVVQQAIGQVLVIHGSGFAFPPDQNVVRVDNVQITAFRPASTSTRLEFLVPAIPNVPPEGRNAVITVQNSGGVVQRMYRIGPSIPVVGNPPAITAIAGPGGETILAPGMVAVVSGANFSTTANENIIRLTATLPGGATLAIPRAGESAIALTQATASQIRFTLPAMAELPLNSIIQMNLQVTVGAHPPASQNFAIRRTV